MKTQGFMMGAVAALATLSWTLPAAAQSAGGAYVVSRGSSAASVDRRIPVSTPQQTSTRLIVRPVLDASAVVDPAVAATPTFPDQVKVVYANSTAVYLNPADRQFIYSPDGIDHIDDNHSLMRALRLAESLRATGAHVVTKSPREAVDTPAPRTARPIFRLRKPDPVTTPQPVAMAERG